MAMCIGGSDLDYRASKSLRLASMAITNVG